MSERDDKCFLCSLCGKISKNPPYECPRDGELDDWVEEDDGVFEGGTFYYDIYCHEAEDSITVSQSEFEIDAANTASYLESWAKAEGWNVEIEWIQVKQNDKWVDRVALVVDADNDDPYLVLGQYFSQCQKRLKEHMESQSA